MMKIPILDLHRQIAPLRREIDNGIRGVIDRTDFILGDQTRLFEKEAAAYCGVKYALGVSNGTDALKLCLSACGIRPGDGVICPSFTYFATAGAISGIGAIPVFADIDPLTYNISPESVRGILLRDKKRKIKAVIPVHLYGQCAEMETLLELSVKFGLKVIEDTAQAFGAEYKGKKAGTLGDCAAVSFYPGKNLGAFGDAGMVLTNNKKISEAVSLLRNQGDKGKYNHALLGGNQRMDGIQAAVLRVKLKYLDSWNAKRLENALFYNRHLQYLDLVTPYIRQDCRHTFHHYVCRVIRRRDELTDYLNKKGIDARVYYPRSLHLQKCFKYLGSAAGDLSESLYASKEVLAIPVFPELKEKEKEYIIDSIKRFFKC